MYTNKKIFVFVVKCIQQIFEFSFVFVNMSLVVLKECNFLTKGSSIMTRS